MGETPAALIMAPRLQPGHGQNKEAAHRGMGMEWGVFPTATGQPLDSRVGTRSQRKRRALLFTRMQTSCVRCRTSDGCGTFRTGAVVHRGGGECAELCEGEVGTASQ